MKMKNIVLSGGEHIVRTGFNPSTSTLVSRIKGLHAQLINLVSSIAPTDSVSQGNVIDSWKRLEESSMFALKAATCPTVVDVAAKVDPMPDKEHLLPHQLRVVEEVEQLSDRVEKLVLFMETTIYEVLDSSEQQRLRRQLTYMLEYQLVLGERIAAFGK